MSIRTRILNIVGARPNLPKIAPIIREMQRHPEIEPLLLHTGQHYDENLSDIFFRQMGIPAPQTNLGVGSGTHAEQTAEILKRVEPILLELRPDLVLVVGDVNSTIAVSLAAVKIGIPVAHVEAGLHLVSIFRSKCCGICRTRISSLASLTRSVNSMAFIV